MVAHGPSCLQVYPESAGTFLQDASLSSGPSVRLSASGPRKSPGAGQRRGMLAWASRSRRICTAPRVWTSIHFYIFFLSFWNCAYRWRFLDCTVQCRSVAVDQWKAQEHQKCGLQAPSRAFVLLGKDPEESGHGATRRSPPPPPSSGCRIRTLPDIACETRQHQALRQAEPLYARTGRPLGGRCCGA